MYCLVTNEDGPFANITVPQAQQNVLNRKITWSLFIGNCNAIIYGQQPTRSKSVANRERVIVAILATAEIRPTPTDPSVLSETLSLLKLNANGSSRSGICCNFGIRDILRMHARLAWLLFLSQGHLSHAARINLVRTLARFGFRVDIHFLSDSSKRILLFCRF